MRKGKLSVSALKRSVLREIGTSGNQVTIGPGVGRDAALLRPAHEEGICVSTDPVSGGADWVGVCAVNRTANNLACAGAEPVAVLLSVLLPPDAEEQELRTIMRSARETCEKLGMEIAGGHTAVTGAVQRPVVTSTGIGYRSLEKTFLSGAAGPGQQIVMTKEAGTEAASLLAFLFADRLSGRFSSDFIRKAQGDSSRISVLPDVKAACAGRMTAVHDLSSGGFFGGLWELAEREKLGLEVDLRSVPIRQETVEICEYFHLNPYQSLSGGSILILTQEGEGMVRMLEAAGIPASLIGVTTGGNDRILRNGEEIRYLDKPLRDDLERFLEETEVL